jgi:intracellular sulfur oxidation DsrE/DsrF family protein
MKTLRRITTVALLALAALTLSCALPPQAGVGVRPHRVIFQVSDADPARWNLTLNNVRNVQQDLGKDNVTIEVVAYGPGIGMLKLESAVGPRVADALASGVAVVACENTMKNQKLSRDDMLSKIGYVDAGVVELMKRQKEGYAYIRP